MLTFQAKEWFLDRKAIVAKLGAARTKFLSRVGGMVRVTAQRSMRYRSAHVQRGKKKGQPAPPSKPGAPPFARTDTRRGPLLREKLWYALDPTTETVVVGPVAFGAGKSKVPALHEFGGSVTINRRIKVTASGRKAHTSKQAEAYKAGIRSGRIPPPHRRRIKTLSYLAAYPARAYMAPALAKIYSRLPTLWANSLGVTSSLGTNSQGAKRVA